MGNLSIYLPRFQHTAARRRLARFNATLLPVRSFNTQPPEGGWQGCKKSVMIDVGFQHTAARRRLAKTSTNTALAVLFQHTAARRRLADGQVNQSLSQRFQHTAARRRLGSFPNMITLNVFVSTHSRPKAAGIGFLIGSPVLWFQHTAARRRLVGRQQGQTRPRRVSTHSRPKAAGQKCQSYPCRMTCFNTQPPEGGWAIHPICHRA